ncbi:MAG: hypothetical protein GY937_03795 [bacterium]|nr:hypothetical protein [bacterium]
MSEEDLEGGGLPDFLRDPMGLLKRRWRSMALVLALGVVATGAIVVSIPVRFLATASILVSGQSMPEEFIRPIVAESSFQRINELVGEVIARDRLLALEKKHDLFPAERAVLPPNELMMLVQESIEVGIEQGFGPRSRGDTSSIYTISFQHSRPDTAAAVANELAGDFAAVSAGLRGEKARLTTQFLRTQLVEKEAELRAQERKITEFKETYRGELPGELQSNLNKLERLAAERQSINLAISEAETRLAMMTSSETPESPNSPLARLTALRSQLAEQRSVYTDEHPNVLSLRRQIATLEKEIADGGATASDPTRQILLESTSRGIDDMRKRLIEIASETADREARVARTPKREEEQAALQQHTEVLRNEYLSFLHKVETAEMAQRLETAQQGERISVLDHALPPSEPERTRLKYMLAGLVASLGLAAALGLSLELLDPVLFSSEQIEEHFGLPVLGSVPRIS